MSFTETTIEELEAQGCFLAIQDGNHGEKHPKSSDYAPEGVPFIMASNISAGHVDIEGASKLPQSITDKLRIGFCFGGDVLLSHKGSVGYVAIAPEHDPYLMLTPQVTYYRVNPHKISGHFLSYAFREPMFQKRLLSIAGQQGTRGYVGIKAQRQLKIRFCPRLIQDRIVDAISPYDDLIENNRRRIALLEDAARMLYREWFVHFRFPGHEHVKISDGLPEGWRRAKIDEIFITYLGGTPARGNPMFWGGTVPWINSGEINKLRIIQASEFITEEGLSRSAAKLMPIGTTVLAITGATLGQVSYLEIECSANQSVVGVYDGRQRLNEIAYLFFKENAKKLILLGSGGAQQHINKDIVNGLDFVEPSEPLIRMFREAAIPIFLQIRNLLFQNAKLSEARDLLLPRLMNGEIAV